MVGPGEEAAEGGGHTPRVAAKLPAADTAASSIAEEKSDIMGSTWYIITWRQINHCISLIVHGMRPKSVIVGGGRTHVMVKIECVYFL